MTSRVTGSIVLIEDDPKVSKAWGLLLKAEGFRVAMVETAKETAALAEKTNAAPDLIISDFHLADGSTGIEAVAILREAYDREIPAFIVTGDTSKLVDAARAVANCVIMNKPVNTDELLENAVAAIETGTVPVE